MLLVPISWAGRVWALPFLTELEQYRANVSRTAWHKPLICLSWPTEPIWSVVLNSAA
jgi:hypothetical protein